MRLQAQGLIVFVAVEVFYGDSTAQLAEAVVSSRPEISLSLSAVLQKFCGARLAPQVITDRAVLVAVLIYEVAFLRFRDRATGVLELKPNRDFDNTGVMAPFHRDPIFAPTLNGLDNFMIMAHNLLGHALSSIVSIEIFGVVRTKI